MELGQTDSFAATADRQRNELMSSTSQIVLCFWFSNWALTKIIKDVFTKLEDTADTISQY